MASSSDESNMPDEVGVNADPTFNMKSMFLDALKTLMQEKAKNTVIFNRDKYQAFIEDVKKAKVKQKKESVDYRRLKKYDVIEVNGEERLIVPVTDSSSDIVYYVHTEELFDLLHNTHLSIGHGGRTRMDKELQPKYKNITKEIIMMYLRLCKHCQVKLANFKKASGSKPLVLKESYSRCLVDIIDMESNPDGVYKFVLCYQDHSTKFIILRALKSTGVVEVADHLLDIFTTIGAPSVLQSGSGREFASRVVDALKNMWAELRLVHGKHTQGQDTTKDVRNMIKTWMKTNNSTRWADNLKFIQFTKNSSLHQDIQQSPFEAMFGCKAKMGLSTSNLPKEVLESLITEEDLEKVELEMTDAAATEQFPDNDAAKFCEVTQTECSLVHSCRFCGSDVEGTCGRSNETGEECEGKVTCEACLFEQENGKRSADCLEEQHVKKFRCGSPS